MDLKEIRRQRKNAYMKEWRASHVERVREINNKAEKKRRADPEYRQYKLDWQRANPEKRSEHGRKYYYNITNAQFVALFDAQDRRCAICKTDAPQSKKPWHLDHDHETGRLRGILCHFCNCAIGWADDDATIPRSAAEYLEAARRDDQ